MQNNRKPIIAAAVVILILIIGGLIALAGTSKKTVKPSPTPTATTYTGTDVLLARGFTADQVEDMKFGFYKYFKSTNRQVKTVAITNVTHFHDGNADPSDYLSFNVTVDNKSFYTGKVLYTDLVSAQLQLFDITNQVLIYDSGVLKVNTGS